MELEALRLLRTGRNARPVTADLRLKPDAGSDALDLLQFFQREPQSTPVSVRSIQRWPAGTDRVIPADVRIVLASHAHQRIEDGVESLRLLTQMHAHNGVDGIILLRCCDGAARTVQTVDGAAIDLPSLQELCHDLAAADIDASCGFIRDFDADYLLPPPDGPADPTGLAILILSRHPAVRQQPGFVPVSFGTASRSQDLILWKGGQRQNYALSLDRSLPRLLDPPEPDWQQWGRDRRDAVAADRTQPLPAMLISNLMIDRYGCRQPGIANLVPDSTELDRSLIQAAEADFLPWNAALQMVQILLFYKNIPLAWTWLLRALTAFEPTGVSVDKPMHEAQLLFGLLLTTIPDPEQGQNQALAALRDAGSTFAAHQIASVLVGTSLRLHQGRVLMTALGRLDRSDDWRTIAPVLEQVATGWLSGSPTVLQDCLPGGGFRPNAWETAVLSWLNELLRADSPDDFHGSQRLGRKT